MDLISRYIHAVGTRLPRADQEEAARDLRVKINAELSESPTDEEIYKVLKEFGDPRVGAKSYQKDQSYLIGPDIYHTYRWVLNLVVVISVLLSVFFRYLIGPFSQQDPKKLSKVL